MRGQKPRLGQKLAPETCIGALTTREALLRLGLRGVANVGRVGCWIWCHWRSIIYGPGAIHRCGGSGQRSGIASAFGQDPFAAASAAQNEALNNCSMHECWNGVKDKLTSFGSAVASWFATPEGQLTSAMAAIAGDMGGRLMVA
ncbi:hypothetical protein AB4156_37520 [Cupriavidus sp. 2MCAB6]|uniref:hypothetical protein n=1 Tax=Cupriavidus sp. 2MCAB6 TaxID=3232981 RepID=UPI003F92C9E8